MVSGLALDFLANTCENEWLTSVVGGNVPQGGLAGREQAQALAGRAGRSAGEGAGAEYGVSELAGEMASQRAQQHVANEWNNAALKCTKMFLATCVACACGCVCCMQGITT